MILRGPGTFNITSALGRGIASEAGFAGSNDLRFFDAVTAIIKGAKGALCELQALDVLYIEGWLFRPH